MFSMPLIAIKVSQPLYNAAMQLVNRREYRDIQQLIEVALANHLQLEKRYESDAIVEDNPARTKLESALHRSITHNKGRAGYSDPGATREIRPKTDLTEAAEPFRFSQEKSISVEPCSVGPRPKDELMYSLVNRLLPLKLAARWLDVRSSEVGHWPEVIDLLSPLGHAVETFGSALSECDRRLNKRRDDQLATSLPRAGKAKSTERFLTQFVVRTTESGEVHDGAIVQFALATIKNGQLVLSREGQRLSRLPNPIIDHPGNHFTESLTEDERSLLRQQIRQYMPAELEYVRALLKTVSAGFCSPAELIKPLRDLFARDSTEAAFRSHLSGVVARAVDLRLLHRDWEGKHVSYSLTDAGREILLDAPSEIPSSTPIQTIQST